MRYFFQKVFARIDNEFTTGKLNEFNNETGQIDNAISCGYSHKHRSFSSEQAIRGVTLGNHIPKHSVVETECVRGIIKKLLKFDMEKRCTEVGLTFEDLFKGILENQIVRYAKPQSSKPPIPITFLLLLTASTCLDLLISLHFKQP